MTRLRLLVGLVCAALVLAACGSSSQPSAGRQTTPTTTTTSSTTAESTTTTSTTSTIRPKPARALHKVMLLGDSEMFDAAPYATEAFKAAGIEVNSQAFPGTSLLGRSQVTQTFPTVLGQVDPDAVILLYTGAYFPPWAKTADGQDILLATPEFFQAWTDAATQATRDLSARGARVYWVLLPYNTDQWLNHDTRLNDAYLAVRSAIATVGYIDWRRTIVNGPNGEPLDVAPIGPGGTLEPVRGPDGRHFSADASHVLADVMVKTVLKDYGLSAAS